MEYLGYLALGSVAGLVSGLFGLGGGTVIVPILLLVFAAQGIPPEISTHMAIATSLACISITSISSIYTHYQKGAVNWSLAQLFIPGMVLGTFIGTSFFVSLDGVALQLLFGVFLLAIGLQMTVYKAVESDAKLPSRTFLMSSGATIGGISALFGVGGGMFTTPLLTHFGVKIHQAIGVAAVGGFCVALPASIVYGVSDISTTGLPESTLGYIFLPAWFGIIVTSAPFARLGAVLAHRANGNQLKKIFGVYLFLLGVRFVWINIGV
jgi:uncharacterized membrane protein YfcA